MPPFPTKVPVATNALDVILRVAFKIAVKLVSKGRASVQPNHELSEGSKASTGVRVVHTMCSLLSVTCTTHFLPSHVTPWHTSQGECFVTPRQCIARATLLITTILSCRDQRIWGRYDSLLLLVNSHHACVKVDKIWTHNCSRRACAPQVQSDGPNRLSVICQGRCGNVITVQFGNFFQN